MASKKEQSEMVSFQMSSRTHLNQGPKMEGEKVNIYVFLLTWTHFGHQGRPMELRGDLKEHVCIDCDPIQEQFWQFVCNEDKANENKSREEVQHKAG